MKFKSILFFSISFYLIVNQLQAQSDLLQSGPMVGYSEIREVMLWVQTKSAAKVKLMYWDQTDVSKKLSTDEITTTKEKAYTAKLVADQVSPGKKYQYELYINGKKISRPYPLSFQTQELWVFRKEPPDFKFAFGSCAYINEAAYDRPGKPYGDTTYKIFKSIYEKKPDFMLWTGDNVYLREADLTSRTGIFYRYTHTRSTPEMQPLFGSVHNYAIWDDHDYGPNDGDRSFWNKKITEETFNLFWCNPNTNLTGKGGVTCTFYWNDVQFFLLDDRYFRTPKRNTILKRTLLGEEQLEWLIDGLTSSLATFKIIVIGGQVLNPGSLHDSYAEYGEEKEWIIKSIKAAKIPGIIFISGDRHFTELSALEDKDFYTLYDVTVSPLTSEVHNRSETNSIQVPNTLFMDRNFAVAEVTGPWKDRKIKFTIYNKNGLMQWEKIISYKELKPVSKP